MRQFAEIRTHINERTAQILERFNEITERDPWIHLPRDFRLDSLPDVLQRLADLALGDSADEVYARSLVQAAAKHGEDRVRQGFHDTLLFQEYYLVRSALWDELRDHPAGAKVITRIDAAISLAVKASLRGFHRPVFEARGAWPEAIEDLLVEWKPMSGR